VKIKKIIDKFEWRQWWNVWSLYHREYIVGALFGLLVGFFIGAVIF
tara:strand:+ start:3649 stop:3786 length:138 start_codon:yes stop_codon:yes gene_type:complete